MEVSLKAFVGSNDYGSQFFDDMVWGGLTTDRNENEYQFFENEIPHASDRERIENTIQIEQTG